MSVVNKSLVIADKGMMVTIIPEIISKLNEWQRALLKKEIESKGGGNLYNFVRKNENWSNGIDSVHTFDFRSFRLIYKMGDYLSIFYTWVEDQNDLAEGEKIVFHFPVSEIGSHAQKIVNDVLVNYGQTFVYNIDSDQYVKIN